MQWSMWRFNGEPELMQAATFCCLQHFGRSDMAGARGWCADDLRLAGRAGRAQEEHGGLSVAFPRRLLVVCAMMLA